MKIRCMGREPEIVGVVFHGPMNVGRVGRTYPLNGLSNGPCHLTLVHSFISGATFQLEIDPSIGCFVFCCTTAVTGELPVGT